MKRIIIIGEGQTEKAKCIRYNEWIKLLSCHGNLGADDFGIQRTRDQTVSSLSRVLSDII